VLKYFVYISKTKVDMLFPQIPPAFLAGAEAELKVNLAVFSAGLTSRNADPPTELAGRVGALAKYIREHEKVGTLDAPGDWVYGTEWLRWGVVKEYASDIALFGGRVTDRTAALLGSRDSILGNPDTGKASHAPFYYTLRFFNDVVQGRAELGGEKPPYYSWREAVDIGLRALPNSPNRLEFLAKVLHLEGELVVATPLYVALES
jgi:hypothetical protein